MVDAVVSYAVQRLGDSKISTQRAQQRAKGLIKYRESKEFTGIGGMMLS